MNPYEYYHAIRDSVHSLLGDVGSLKLAYGGNPEAFSILEDLQARLIELQTKHLRLWQLQKRTDYHLELIVSKLESMDTLCGQLSAQLDTANMNAIRKSSRGRNSPRHGFRGCCYPLRSDETMDTVEAVEEQLKIWLETQTAIADILTSQALGVSPRLKTLTRVGYEPLTKLSVLVADVLENGQRKVVVIHGLSGIGKSSLAEYVASHPSERFCEGAVKLQLGQACSMSASGNRRKEYEKLLASKLSALLSDLKNDKMEISRNASLEHIWSTLADTLRGSSYLIVLDDVWETDIISRFTRLLNNDCRYLVTCSTNFIDGEVEATAVEVNLEDVCQVSTAIFRFHSGLCSKQMLPVAGKRLVNYSSHHPLALAIQAEALRGVKVKEWGMTIGPLLQNKLPISQKSRYLSKKKLQLERIMFSSIEFSLSGMEKETKDLFKALAALSWLQPVPVACLQALWVGLGWSNPFMLQARELVRRCLLQRTPDFSHFSLQQTVSLYLETEAHTAVKRLLTSSSPEIHASVAPWLFFFGKVEAKDLAIIAFLNVLRMSEGDLQVQILLAAADVLKSSEILVDLELPKFNKLVGHEIITLLSKASSPTTHASIARYLAVGFNASEFQTFSHDLINAGLIQKITPLLSSKLNLKVLVKNEVADVLAKMARTKADYVIDELLRRDVIKQLVLVLETKLEWIHKSAIDAIVSLFEVGEAAVKQVLEAGLFEIIMIFLEDRKDFKKYRALNILQHLFSTGQNIVFEKVLASNLIEKLETLLQGSTEGLQITTASVYKQLIEIGGDPCLKKIFQTQAVESLCLMLQSSSKSVQLAAINVILQVVEAKGSTCAQRLFKAGALENLGEILQENLEGQTSDDAKILYSLLSEWVLYAQMND
ncbi:hypothetical protein O6H91_Y060800 [Diphasiastrum complanatum]|nr:hypothetical protein O6H91_Y060800 [Diphasiastrum complanatum]